MKNVCKGISMCRNFRNLENINLLGEGWSNNLLVRWRERLQQNGRKAWCFWKI